MNFSTLAEFRRNTYACFARAADALMDVVDALLTETPAEARRFVSRPIRLPEEVPTLYARRYNLEHGYRTAKQDLLWETPRLRTPEPFARWTDVVSVVRNLLFLARDMVEAHRQPWESKSRACTPESEFLKKIARNPG